jgi:hypothetical protein
MSTDPSDEISRAVYIGARMFDAYVRKRTDFACEPCSEYANTITKRVYNKGFRHEAISM